MRPPRSFTLETSCSAVSAAAGLGTRLRWRGVSERDVIVLWRRWKLVAGRGLVVGATVDAGRRFAEAARPVGGGGRGEEEESGPGKRDALLRVEVALLDGHERHGQNGKLAALVEAHAPGVLRVGRPRPRGGLHDLDAVVVAAVLRGGFGLVEVVVVVDAIAVAPVALGVGQLGARPVAA